MKHSSLGLFLRGLAMGTADVIPGVSGGTVAFVTGIYSELIQILSKLGIQQLKDLVAGRFKNILADLHLKFTVPLGLGLIVAILSMARLMPFVMREYPFQTYSFFFTLIVFSAYAPFSMVKKNKTNIFLVLLSAALSFLFFNLNTEFSLPQSFFGFFVAGCISICAMILPGISGAYLLVLMGQYEFVLQAIHERDLFVIASFGLGCTVGILSFVRLLAILLRSYADLTYAFLTGLLLGSLVKIWPFDFYVSTDETALSLSVSVGLVIVAALIMSLAFRISKQRN